MLRVEYGKLSWEHLLVIDGDIVEFTHAGEETKVSLHALHMYVAWSHSLTAWGLWLPLRLWRLLQSGKSPF